MRKVGLFLLAAGIALQAIVPGWMLLKRHLILTRGEAVGLPVTLHDPRDLFMGHYVRLSPKGDLPETLEGVPRDYLRYYCDQRYAKPLERAVGGSVDARLTVRVWRGQALAEALTIAGLPAYAYAAQVQPLVDGATAGKKPAEADARPLRLARLDPLPRLMWRNAGAVRRMIGEPDRLAIVAPLDVPTMLRRLDKAPPDAPVVTPKEAAACWEAQRGWFRIAYDDASPGDLVPLPTSRHVAPAGAEAVAETFFKKVSERRYAREGPLYIGPGDDAVALAAARRIVRDRPDVAFVLRARAVPEGLPAKNVILLTDTPPADNAVRWLLPARPAAEAPLPPGCLGWMETLSPLTLPPPEPGRAGALAAQLRDRPELATSTQWAATFCEALAREAAARGDAALLEAALARCRDRTMGAWFERCETYADYVAFVKELAALPEPPHLAGAEAAIRALPNPPEPPPALAPTAPGLAALAERVARGTH